MLFAQLLTTSPHLINADVKSRLLPFMEDFLMTASYKEIREEEVRNGYKWSTLIPFMKLAYHPLSRSQMLLRSLGKDAGVELEPEIQERLDRYVGHCVWKGDEPFT